MGYNKCRRYLSPLQVAHIHKRYTTDTVLIKTTTANEYDTLIILRFGMIVLEQSMMVKGDIIVRKGTVNYKLAMLVWLMEQLFILRKKQS